MEENQEHKFVCKICGKSCFSGRSLGGHMRGHVAATSGKKQQDYNGSKMCLDSEKPKEVVIVSDSSHSKLENLKNSEMGGSLESGCPASYGLRENPKKTWRVSDSKPSIEKKETHCKECGKEFPSMRALSGHMRCHSIKDKENHLCKQCGKGFVSLKALFGHMRHHSKRSRPANESAESQSDYDTLCLTRRKRSRARYKFTNNSSSSNLNSSLFVSEIVELEEAAFCLIMMSRAVRNWAELDSVLGDSEHNHVIFKSKALEDYDESWEMKKPSEKLDYSGVLSSGNSLREKNESELGELDAGFKFNNEDKAELVELDAGFMINNEEKTELAELDAEFMINNEEEAELVELDAGFMINNEKKPELESSIEGFHKGDTDEEFKKPELDDESVIQLSDTEIKNRSEATEVELEKDSVTEVGLDQPDSMEAISDVQDSELMAISCDGITDDSEIFEDSEKKREYRCTTCNKIFDSYQALGGHSTSHRSFVLKIEKSLVLTDNDAKSKLDKLECNENLIEEKKSKDHECPICFKVFPSGQALGGHKRAHYTGLSENTTQESSTILAEQKVSEIKNICDLNLPLNLEKDVNDDVGFKLWWVGSDHKREPLLISN
ncbi:hypothetical protein U1Q18_012262 [Sarracenia purpurea var. burkii]